MNVVQLSFFVESEPMPPRDVLERWDTIRLGASALARQGVRVTVVLGASVDESLLLDGARYEFRHVRRWTGGSARATRWLGGVGRLLDAVREARPTVIHLHGFVAPLHVWVLARSVPRVPIVVQDHANVPSRGLRRWLDRSAFSRVSGAAFTSREQAEPFVTNGVLPGSVPLFEVLEASSNFVPGDRSEARRLSGIDGDPALLWVGRLDANKDPFTVLDAVEDAVRVLPDLRLWCLYQDAPLLDAVRRRIGSSRRLQRSVHLLGAVGRSEIESYYRSADIYVTASHREGSGFALIEALACGTPALATSIPSFRRITGNGRVGALFPPGDGRRLGAEIVRLGTDGMSGSRDAVRSHFERELSWDVVGRDWLHVCMSLANAS